MMRTLVILTLVATVAGFVFFAEEAQAQSAACEPGAAVPDDASAGLVSDCEALMASKSALKGSSGSLNWWSGRSIDRWHGVTIRNGRVSVLDLRDRDLDGTIPEHLTRLDALEGLYLSGNSFTGCIPPALNQVPLNDLDTLGQLFCGDTQPPPTPTPTRPTPPSDGAISDMVEEVRTSVVFVKAVNYGRPDGWYSYGSGFIFRVDNSGAAYILTNQHMVDEAESVAVVVDDRDWYEADIRHVDPRRDIAMLRICCSQHFKAVQFMDTTPMRAGDEVITIGYPADHSLPGAPPRAGSRIFQLPEDRKIIPGEATVTRGIISAFRYSTPRDAQIVQYDAATSPGSSGGPLFTRDGLVVGMSTFGLLRGIVEGIGIRRQGMNFGILETTIQERVRLWDVGPSARFGPLGGRLRHDNDNFIEQFSPNFTADSDEFVLDATFVNPYGADAHPWDYGFKFGQTGDDDYVRLYVHSSGSWGMRVSKPGTPSTLLHSGLVPQLLTGAGEKNRVTLYVDGKFGWLFVNGQPVLDREGNLVQVSGRGIDLGGEDVTSHGGSVAIVTGFFVGDERAGAVTRYEGFRGWTYDHSR